MLLFPKHTFLSKDNLLRSDIAFVVCVVGAQDGWSWAGLAAPITKEWGPITEELK